MCAQVCSSCNLRCNQEGVPIEAFLKDHLQHPQLVRLIDSATAQRSAAPRFGRRESMDISASMTPPRSSSAALSDEFADMHVPADLELETWLLLEYCDMGTLMVSQHIKAGIGLNQAICMTSPTLWVGSYLCACS